MSNAEKTVMFALPNMMTGQLACVAGSAAGRSWELSAGTFTIGRLEEHDMSLPQEPGISKLHAKIIGQGDRYLITDCESRNGTLLNGELIQRADLYDGDEISICGCVLRFTQKGGPTRPRPRVAPPVAAPAPAAEIERAASSVSVAEPVSSSPSPSPSPVRTLAAWYGSGLVGALLVGSITSATLLATSGPPPTTTVSGPVAVVAVAPAVPVAPVAPAVVAAVVPPAAAAVVDAGVIPVEQVAAAEAAAAEPELADSPTPTPTPTPSPPPTRPANATETKPVATSSTFAATPERGRSDSVRTRTGGRVRSVEVADGASVSRGTVLVTFETGADADEIATLQDRISSLEAVEGEEAKRDLKTAKARLAALEAGQKAQPIVAAIDGRLSGFSVAPGTVLKPGEVVGTIDGEVSARVRVVVRGVTAKSGQQVTLTLKSGETATGTVASVAGKVVIVNTGTTAAAGVASVSF